MKEQFIELLKSTNREGIENLLAFLEKTDFYAAPASTKYHGAYKGGLLEHSMKVYEILKEKIKNEKLDVKEQDIVSLAKRLEEVFLPNETDSIIFARTSPALYFFQRIRDEAHRFAITFHRQLRQKSALASQKDKKK